MNHKYSIQSKYFYSAIITMTKGLIHGCFLYIYARLLNNLIKLFNIDPDRHKETNRTNWILKALEQLLRKPKSPKRVKGTSQQKPKPTFI